MFSFKQVVLHAILFCVCMVCGNACSTMYIWRPEDNYKGQVLSFHMHASGLHEGSQTWW